MGLQQSLAMDSTLSKLAFVPVLHMVAHRTARGGELSSEVLSHPFFQLSLEQKGIPVKLHLSDVRAAKVAESKTAQALPGSLS